MRTHSTLTIVVCLLFAAACTDRAPTPKPRMYPRIEFPQKTYQQFAETYCPFSFEYPAYGKIVQQTSFFEERPSHPCWFDIVIDSLNARIHCSYYSVDSRADYDQLVDDAYNIANKINQRSNYMEDMQVSNARGVSGIIMEFTGPAASPMNFYLTDTSRHFLRGSLYFNARVDVDSLKPVADFLKADVAHLVNTFAWRD